MDSVVTQAAETLREALSGARSWSDVERALPAASGRVSPGRLRTMRDVVARMDLRHRRRFGSMYGPQLPSAPMRGAVLEQMARESAQYSARLPARLNVALKVRLDRARRTDEPFSAEALRQYVGESIAITRRHARVVSEDQAINVVGRLNKRRQELAGVRRYRWRTMRDDRVRDTHRANDGETFRWDSPPPRTGHPGSEINCRCTAEPVTPRRSAQL